LGDELSRASAVTPRRILLINPNISPLVTQILADEARKIVGDAATIRAVTAPFGSASLECRAELIVAAHAVLEAIAAEKDYDCAIIGAFGDPGLDAAQDIAGRPVFGLGRSGLRAAAADGRRFAIVTVGARMRGDIERALASLGLSGRLAAIRFLESSVLGLAQDRDRLTDDLAALANACAQQDGAQSVLFGGAPFAGIGRQIAERVVVPVFDGLTAAVMDAMGAPARESAEESPAKDKARKMRSGVSEALAARLDDFLNRRE
jgi:allantoin racemase